MLPKLLTQGHSIRPYYHGSNRRNHCNLHGAGRRDARDDPVRRGYLPLNITQLKKTLCCSNIQGYIKAVHPRSDAAVNQTSVLPANLFASANASDVQVQSFREACGYVEWTSVPDHAAGILFSVCARLSPKRRGLKLVRH